MSDPKKMSVEDILAACRGESVGAGDAGGGDGASELDATQPEASSQKASPSGSNRPAQTGGSGGDPPKNPSEMSVADILAAARGDAGGAATSASTTPSPESSGSAVASDASVGGASSASKKPSEMSVAEMLAAARGQGAPAAKGSPAKKAAPAPKRAAKPPAASAEGAVEAGPKDTSSILAAARKAVKPGPMSKKEATEQAKQPAAGRKPVLPPKPEKPPYAIPAAKTEPTRRGLMALLTGSAMALGFVFFTLTNLVWGLGLARFMFPNVLTEPPSRFKIGFPGDFAPESVNTALKAQFGVWIVNTQYEGIQQIFALRSVCTHLGCTPNWLEAEQKFKCPCHGSGFYKDGINFEGPAPRPLERYAIRLADDGQIEVDKSRVFQQEMGQWKDAGCFVAV